MLAPPKPPHDELELLIKEARERQLRRRLLGAAGVAIAAALGLSVYALTLGRGDNGPTATRSSGIAAVSMCTGTQLAATTFLQAATMSGVGAINIKNVSSDACLLPRGIPSVRITWHGRTLHVKERTMGWQGQPVDLLRPGARAAVPLLWSNWCGRPRGMSHLVFYARFPNGLDVRAPQRLTGHPGCEVRSAPSLLGVGRPVRS